MSNQKEVIILAKRLGGGPDEIFPCTLTVDGKLRVEAAVVVGGIEVDIESLERGGDDSVSADLNVASAPVTSANPVPTIQQGSANRFYGDQASLVSGVGAFGAANPIGFDTIAIVVACDAGQDVEVSFDGVATHGKINSGESFTYFPKKETNIYFKRAVAGTTFRAWAW